MPAGRVDWETEPRYDRPTKDNRALARIPGDWTIIGLPSTSSSSAVSPNTISCDATPSASLYSPHKKLSLPLEKLYISRRSFQKCSSDLPGARVRVGASSDSFGDSRRAWWTRSKFSSKQVYIHWTSWHLTCLNCWASEPASTQSCTSLVTVTTTTNYNCLSIAPSSLV